MIRKQQNSVKGSVYEAHARHASSLCSRVGCSGGFLLEIHRKDISAKSSRAATRRSHRRLETGHLDHTAGRL